LPRGQRTRFPLVDIVTKCENIAPPGEGGRDIRTMEGSPLADQPDNPAAAKPADAPGTLPADINERIAQNYLDDRDEIRKAGAQLRTTAQWIMSTIGAVAVALSGGAAILSNLGHLSLVQGALCGVLALAFLLGVAVSIYACSSVMESEDTTAEGNPSVDTKKLVRALGPYYGRDPDSETVEKAARDAEQHAEKKAKDAADHPDDAKAQLAARSAAGTFIRHHAAEQKLSALIWYEQLLQTFNGARKGILAGAVCAALAFVGFIAVTEISAADADAPAHAADLAKTKAETQKTKAETRQTNAQINAPPP
jgi:hypothetical protein